MPPIFTCAILLFLARRAACHGANQQPVDTRVDALLSQMPSPEMVAQL